MAEEGPYCFGRVILQEARWKFVSAGGAISSEIVLVLLSRSLYSASSHMKLERPVYPFFPFPPNSKILECVAENETIGLFELLESSPSRQLRKSYSSTRSFVDMKVKGIRECFIFCWSQACTGSFLLGNRSPISIYFLWDKSLHKNKDLVPTYPSFLSSLVILKIKMDILVPESGPYVLHWLWEFALK